jgi:3-phosphoshikimate 1-carboxyvinyltransferase
MGASLINDENGGILHVSKPIVLRSGHWNLRNSPDLFPVLAVLCSFAEGRTILFGAPHLAFKESNRIEKTAELLRLSGCAVEAQDDGIAIFGNSLRNRVGFTFDPDQDHRLAMAAGILMLMGFPIQLSNSNVVDKSFPEFWQYIGMTHAS